MRTELDCGNLAAPWRRAAARLAAKIARVAVGGGEQSHVVEHSAGHGPERKAGLPHPERVTAGLSTGSSRVYAPRRGNARRLMV